MTSTFFYDAEWDRQLQQAYKAGKRGLKANRQAGPVAPPAPEHFLRLSEDHSKTGSDLMRQGKLGVLHLSGGLATRFGEIKATHAVAEFAGRPRTFLELKIAHVLWAGRQYGGPIAYALMNSPMTEPVVCEFLQKNRYFGLDAGRVFAFVQSVLKRKIPRPEDMPDRAGSAFAGQEPGEFLKPANEEQELLTWAPAGHFDAVASLIGTRVLANMIDAGMEYLHISNIDNLAATLNPAILGLLAESPEAILVEVAMKKPGDKGGVPVAWKDKGIVLLEEFALPQGFDAARVPQFNTATYWIKVDALLRLFDITAGQLRRVSDAELQQKIRAVRRKIPAYTTLKSTAWDGKPAWVVQDEQLLGDITRLYLEATGKSAQYLLINTDERFIPIKNKEDLIQKEGQIKRVLGDSLLWAC